MGLEVGGICWFSRELERKVRNGMNTFFWKDAWVSNVPLMESFPRLFSLACSQDGKVGELYRRSSEGISWRIGWKRELFEWKNELVSSLWARLEGVVLGEGSDVWAWRADKEGVFSVKSCYSLIQNLSSSEGVLNLDEELIFRDLWRSKAPTKVLAFSWTLLLDRIPSKVNLAKRRSLGLKESKRCVFCDIEDESATHLFLHCDFISKVWSEVMRWLNFYVITPPNLLIHSLVWSREVRSKKLRRGAWLIWHAVVWVVWKARNNHIFNNIVPDVEDLVEQVRVLSWQWSMSRLKIATCLFYEWCWNPRFCLGG